MKVSNQVITFAVGLLISVLVFSIIILYSENIKSKKETETALLRQDSLMAIKQLLDKEIFMLQNKFDSLREKDKKQKGYLSK